MENIQEHTRNMEASMIAFAKDLLSLLTLLGFSAAALTWMDAAAHLV